MEAVFVVLVLVLIPGSLLVIAKVFEHAIRQRNALPASGALSQNATTARQVASDTRALRRTLRGDLADLDRREGVA